MNAGYMMFVNILVFTLLFEDHFWQITKVDSQILADHSQNIGLDFDTNTKVSGQQLTHSQHSLKLFFSDYSHNVDFYT